MASFFQFYENIQRSKLNQSLDEFFLIEMPMRPEGQPDQYVGASPHKPHTAKDGYQGRNTQNIGDQGSTIDRLLGRQKWNQAVEERPELGVYSQVNQELAKDRKAAKAADSQIPMADKARNINGRVVQDIKANGEEEDPEAVVAQNRGPQHAMNQFDQLKQQLIGMRQDGTDWNSPHMMPLVHKMYDLTSAFLKRGLVKGPVAEEMAKARNKMAEIIDKADIQPTAGSQSLIQRFGHGED